MVGHEPVDVVLDVRLVVEDGLKNLDSLRFVLVLNATQNLSGRLAVRSSTEDECENDDLALIAGQKHLSTGRDDRYLTRRPRNCDGVSGGRQKPGQYSDCANSLQHVCLLFLGHAGRGGGYHAFGPQVAHQVPVMFVE